MDGSSGEREHEFLRTFSHMMIEDFLARNGMESTLNCFRQEWERPSEEQVCNSWYEIALKLRLPELVSQNSKGLSVMENLVQALVRESSVRCRQSPQVLMTGLAALPKASALPTIVDAVKAKAQVESGSSPLYSPTHKGKDRTQTIAQRSGGGFQNFGSGGLKSDGGKEGNGGGKDKSAHHLHSQHHRHTKQTGGRSKPSLIFTSGTSGTSNSVSNENWIPDEIRMRSMLRDLSAAKETFTAIRKRETEYDREMKRLMVSDLDRAKTEESLDATRKIPCGCCTQMFLYVNLPLKVSRKAILDIRIKWSGKLSSASVFDPVGQVSGNDEFEDSSSIALHSKKKEEQLFSGGNLGQVPRCYDHVGVCVFCAQFFQMQEDYRPSYEAITFQERKAAFLETKRREREYWNPLKMIEKDREAAAASVAAHSALLYATVSEANDGVASLAGGASTNSSVEPDK